MLKKIIIFFFFFLICFQPIKAYTFNDAGIDTETRTLLNDLSANWPTNLEEGRIALITKAATLMNKNIPYKKGGATTTELQKDYPSGMDCSDYVSWAFNHSGASDVGLGWWTGTYSDNIGSIFTQVNDNEILPGDIALNEISQSQNNHVAIYIGTMNGSNYYFHSTNTTSTSGPQVRIGNGGSKIFLRYHNWSTLSNNASGPQGGLTTDPFNTPSLTTDNFTCETIFFNSDGTEKDLKKLLDGIFIIMQIAAPVIAIALSIYDYIKVIASGEASTKKANKKTIIRVAIAISILILPYILDLLFHIFGLYDISRCKIGN